MPWCFCLQWLFVQAIDCWGLRCRKVLHPLEICGEKSWSALAVFLHLMNDSSSSESEVLYLHVKSIISWSVAYVCGGIVGFLNLCALSPVSCWADSLELQITKSQVSSISCFGRSVTFEVEEKGNQLILNFCLFPSKVFRFYSTMLENESPSSSTTESQINVVIISDSTSQLCSSFSVYYASYFFCFHQMPFYLPFPVMERIPCCTCIGFFVNLFWCRGCHAFYHFLELKLFSFLAFFSHFNDDFSRMARIISIKLLFLTNNTQQQYCPLFSWKLSSFLF